MKIIDTNKKIKNENHRKGTGTARLELWMKPKCFKLQNKDTDDGGVTGSDGIFNS